jgi:pyruvate,water dikinase
VKELVGSWAIPLFNDFLTETFFGTLNRMIRSAEIRDAENLDNDLLCGTGGVESLAPTLELLDIARWAGERSAVRDLLAADEKAACEAVLRAETGELAELRSRVMRYVDAYGFRCVNELKLEERTIKDDPSFVFSTLKNYLRKGAELFEAGKREKDIRENAEAKAFSHMTGWRLVAFKWVLENTRERIKAREELRFLRTKIYGIARNIFKAFGRNFAVQGILEAPEDVFFLTVQEIFEIVESRSTSERHVRELVAIRKKAREENLAKSSPDRVVFYGDLADGRYLEIVSPQDARAPNEEGRLKGVGCSPGIVTGEAKIVLDPGNVELNGAILVTRRTDPGWVPLFPCIKGLVIERGSVLSHSAVVAREMGIPTVVGARGATRLIKDGERIVVNGGSGYVERETA